MQHERAIFLKKRKKEKNIIIISRLFIIIFIIFAWEIFAHFNIINTFLTSSPSLICKTFIKLFFSNNLINHILVTLYEVLISFIIASVLGIIIATILWCNKTLAKIIDPYLTVLNSLPKVALGPLIIIILGASKISIIFMSLLICIFITIINVYNAFMSTDNNYILLVKSMNGNKKDLYFNVILQSNLLNIINCLKVNISLSFIGLLPPVGEKIFFNKCYSRY